MNDDARKNVDLLIEQFWKRGYFTISRKYGTYLPEPAKVGGFDVDIIARYKKDYAIGITLTADDLNSEKLVEKLTYLATRKTKYTNKRVNLFVGIQSSYYKQAKMFIEKLDADVRSNIKLFPIVERGIPVKRKNRGQNEVLFS